MAMKKLRVTKTLLDNWLWVYKKDDGYEDFLKTLNREPIQANKAMLDGQRFENCVNGVLDGNPLNTDHEWYKPVMTMANYLQGSQQQVNLFQDIEVDGVSFLLHGILDYLRNGVIYDCKFSPKYKGIVGPVKYINSTQHPLYFGLVPEARRFEYLISDGEYVYKETYYPEDCVPIEKTIKDFMRFLEQYKLIDTFAEKWSIENDYFGKKD